MASSAKDAALSMGISILPSFLRPSAGPVRRESSDDGDEDLSSDFELIHTTDGNGKDGMINVEFDQQNQLQMLTKITVFRPDVVWPLSGLMWYGVV